MKTAALFVILLAIAARADWISVPIDFTVGADAPASATIATGAAAATKTESTYKLLLPGDSLTFSPTSLTNAVRFRITAERQR